MADLLGINLSSLAEQQLLRSEGNNHVRVTKSRSLLDQLRSGARGTSPTHTSPTPTNIPYPRNKPYTGSLGFATFLNN